MKRKCVTHKWAMVIHNNTNVIKMGNTTGDNLNAKKKAESVQVRNLR